MHHDTPNETLAGHLHSHEVTVFLDSRYGRPRPCLDSKYWHCKLAAGGYLGTSCDTRQMLHGMAYFEALAVQSQNFQLCYEDLSAWQEQFFVLSAWLPCLLPLI